MESDIANLYSTNCPWYLLIVSQSVSFYFPLQINEQLLAHNICKGYTGIWLRKCLKLPRGNQFKDDQISLTAVSSDCDDWNEDKLMPVSLQLSILTQTEEWQWNISWDLGSLISSLS